jgi:superfamily I DNA and/or RNA helicase
LTDAISFNELKENIGLRSASSALSNYLKGSEIRRKKLKVPQRLLLEFNETAHPDVDIEKTIISSMSEQGYYKLDVSDFFTLNESEYMISQEFEEEDKELLGVEGKIKRLSHDEKALYIRNFVMKNIISRYHTIKKEKGRHTCYLTFHMMKGKDLRTREERPLNMPILLIPIEIELDQYNTDIYTIRPEQSGDIAINPVILSMYGDFEDMKEPVADLYNIDRDIWLDNYFNDTRLGYVGKDKLLGSSYGMGLLGELKRVFIKSKQFRKNSFEIIDKCTIGIYDFKTYLIHSDYNKNQKFFEESPNIEVLTGKRSAVSFESRFIYPKEDFSIYPSDATQSYAISAVRNGGDVFLHGPPGTGKSQTIVNLIAQFMAEGKRVLFVAEKMEALNVVYDRLKHDGDEEIGLDAFCLKITDDSSKFMTPKKLIEQLKRANDKINSALKKNFQYYNALDKISDNIINYYYKVNENDILNRLYGKLLAINKKKVEEINVEIPEYKYNPQNPTIPVEISEAIHELFREYPLTDSKFIKDCVEFDRILNVDKLLEDNLSGEEIFQRLTGLRDRLRDLLQGYLKDTIFKTLTVKDFIDFFKEIAPYVEDTLIILNKKGLLEELLNADIDNLTKMMNSIEEMKGQIDTVKDKYSIEKTKREEYNIPENIKEIDVEKAFDLLSSLQNKVLSFSEEKLESEIESYKEVIARFREQLANTRRIGEIITTFTAGQVYNAGSFNEILSMSEVLKILNDDDIKSYLPKRGFMMDSRKLETYLNALSKMKEMNQIKQDILDMFLEKSEFGLPMDLNSEDINKRIEKIRDILYDVREELDELKDTKVKKFFTGLFDIKSEARKEIESNLKTRFKGRKANQSIRNMIEGLERIEKLKLDISSILSQRELEQFLKMDIPGTIKLQRTISDIYEVLKSYSGIDYQIDTGRIISSPDKVEEMLSLKANLKNPADTLRGYVSINKDMSFDEIERIIKDIESDLIALEKYFGNGGILKGAEIHNLKRYLTSKTSTNKQITQREQRFKKVFGERLYNLAVSDVDSTEKSLQLIQKIVYSSIFIAQKELTTELINALIPKLHLKEQMLREIDKVISKYYEIKDYLYNIDKIESTKISSLNSKFTGIVGKKTSKATTKREKKDHLRDFLSLERDLRLININNLSAILISDLNSGKIKSADDILNGISKSIISKEIDRFESLNKISPSISNDIKKFINYEDSRLKYNRAIIPYKLRGYLREKMKDDIKLKELISNLDTKLTFSNKHTELRSAFDEAYQAAMVLTPCWMMTPNIVSLLMKDPSPKNPDYKGKFLTDLDRFDLVVFDEASQIRVEDAVPALARANQFIVIGDDKQLPPSRRFEIGEKHMHSLMHEVQNVIPIKLLWHYRSISEELIQFSNKMFYNSSLIFYPSTYKNDDYGIHLIKVEGEWDERKNKVEADKAVALFRKHLRSHKSESIGIVTINEEQKKYIIDKLGKDYLKICGGRESFVKNIENVQGDERDVIILSIAYTGTSKKFGEISISDEGRKRLNVAITRSRKRMYVLAHPDLLLLNLDDTQEGHFLIDFLRFCDKVTSYKEKHKTGLSFSLNSDTSQVLKMEIATELSGDKDDVSVDYGEKDKEIHIAYRKKDRYHAIMTDHDNGELLVPDDEIDDKYSIRDREITIKHLLEERGWSYHRITCQEAVKKQINKMIK